VFLRASIPIVQQIGQCIRDNRRTNVDEIISEVFLALEGNLTRLVLGSKENILLSCGQENCGLLRKCFGKHI
jgi:hypothetical protein